MSNTKKRIVELDEATELDDTDYILVENSSGFKKLQASKLVKTLTTKTITQNGIYSADDYDSDGFSSVTVIVSGAGNVWIDNQDQTLTIKISADGDVRIYFNGYTINSSEYVVNLPQKLQCYFTMLTNDVIYTKSYGSDKTTQNGNVGLYQNEVRFWSIDLSVLQSGTLWAVLDRYGNSVQTNAYEAPTYD